MKEREGERESKKVRVESSWKLTSSGEARKFGNYCFTLRAFSPFPRPFPDRPSLLFFPRKSKILPTSPGREDARDRGGGRGREAGDKQVLGHNKGVSIHGRELFICKPRGWPSVWIISSDFPGLCVSARNGRLAEKTRAIVYDGLFYRINGKFNIHNCNKLQHTRFVTSTPQRIFIYKLMLERN